MKKQWIYWTWFNVCNWWGQPNKHRSLSSIEDECIIRQCNSLMKEHLQMHLSYIYSTNIIPTYTNTTQQILFKHMTERHYVRTELNLVEQTELTLYSKFWDIKSDLSMQWFIKSWAFSTDNKGMTLKLRRKRNGNSETGIKLQNALTCNLAS